MTDERALQTATARARLRRLERTDLDEVCRIETQSFPAPWPRSAFEMALTAPELLCLAAVLENHLAGYLIGCPDGPSFLIANIAVDRTRRRGGLGGHLLDHAIRWARATGARECRLEVRVSNESAQALYRCRGFVRVGRRLDYYSAPDEDAVSMALDLRPRGPRPPR